jgi:hypothetical protein
MAIDDVDHFHQRIPAIRADCRYEFDIPRAPDFAVDSRSAFTARAVGRVVSG